MIGEKFQFKTSAWNQARFNHRSRLYNRTVIVNFVESCNCQNVRPPFLAEKQTRWTETSSLITLLLYSSGEGSGNLTRRSVILEVCNRHFFYRKKIIYSFLNRIFLKNKCLLGYSGTRTHFVNAFDHRWLFKMKLKDYRDNRVGQIQGFFICEQFLTVSRISILYCYDQLC